MYEPEKMKSTPGVRSDLFPRPLDKALLTDFFGGVSQAEVVGEESIEYHRRSDVTEKVPEPSAGEQKLKALKPSAVEADTVQVPLRKGDIPGATVRAWIGAGLIGLFVAWVSIGASR